MKSNTYLQNKNKKKYYYRLVKKTVELIEQTQKKH